MPSPKTPEAPAPTADPAAEDESGIPAHEYIAELEVQIGALTGQLIQMQIINRKLRAALTEKKGADSGD